MKILIVEDEPKTGSYLRQGLGEAGYVCDLADTGADGLHLARQGSYELLILDVMLPGLNGWQILRSLREDGITTPVLFLTARDQVEDRVKGLEMGADDYLVKPFALAELAVRVEALLRRAQGRSLGGVLRRGRLEIDREARTVRVDGAPVRLPPKPYRLLELLADRADKVFAHEELERSLWGDEVFRSEALRTLVATTRRLFSQAGCGLDPIETLHGHGYRLRAR